MKLSKHEFSKAVSLFPPRDEHDKKVMDALVKRMDVGQLMEFMDITNNIAFGDNLEEYIDTMEELEVEYGYEQGAYDE